MTKKKVRYISVVGSQTGHDCCFAATVIDTTKPDDGTNHVCECFDKQDADMICEALNFMHPLELK